MYTACEAGYKGARRLRNWKSIDQGKIHWARSNSTNQISGTVKFNKSNFLWGITAGHLRVKAIGILLLEIENDINLNQACTKSDNCLGFLAALGGVGQVT